MVCFIASDLSYRLQHSIDTYSAYMETTGGVNDFCSENQDVGN